VQEQFVGDFFFQSLWAYQNDDPAEQWQSCAIRGSNPRWASSSWGRSSTPHGGNTCAKCGCCGLRRSVLV
jgi:hypothetical protein